MGFLFVRKENSDRRGDCACGRFVNFCIWNLYIVSVWGVGKEFGAKVFGGGEEIYLSTGIKRTTDEYSDEENISDCARAFSGVTVSSNNYEGEIQDIFFLAYRAKQRENR